MKKKRLLIGALMCFVVLKGSAQVYAYDTWTQLPTMDLYDTGMMNMYARALEETSARRQEYFSRYSDLAMEAYRNNRWRDAIYYVNEALGTRYYSGAIYYIRGYAYEQLGDLRAAKKDYKKGKKYHCAEASLALKSLKARKKRR